MVTKLIVLISFISLTTGGLYAQVSQSGLEKAVDELHELLNKKRKASNLPEFLNDKSLAEASMSQAAYLVKSDDLTHEQKGSRMKTPEERVKSSGGEFELVFELVAEITSQEERMKRGELLDNLPAVIDAWTVREPDLATSRYSHAGISVVYDSKRDLVFCVLLLAKE